MFSLFFTKTALAEFVTYETAAPLNLPLSKAEKEVDKDSKEGLSSATLLVTLPDTVEQYNTKAKAYRLLPHELACYANNEWAAPPQMFLPLLVKTLQNRALFHAVLTPPTISQYEYLLKTTIIDFEQDFSLKPAVFRVTLQLNLTRMSDKKVIYSARKTVLAPIGEDSPTGVKPANAGLGEKK